MTIARNGSAVTGSGAANLTFQVSISPANGDLVVLAFKYNDGTITSVVDDLSNNYQLDKSYSPHVYIYSHYYASGGSRTITVTVSQYGSYAYCAQRYSGVASSSYVGTTQSYDNGYYSAPGSRPWTTTSPPTNYASGSLCFAANSGTYGNVTGFTPDSPYSAVCSYVGGSLDVEDWIATSSGNTAATGTDTSTGDWEGYSLFVEYKAATGGGLSIPVAMHHRKQQEMS
jgi:hypothetical protein